MACCVLSAAEKGAPRTNTDETRWNGHCTTVTVILPVAWGRMHAGPCMGMKSRFIFPMQWSTIGTLSSVGETDSFLLNNIRKIAVLRDSLCILCSCEGAMS